MKCPFCNAEFNHIRVIDTRAVGDIVRRRRKCEQCQQRFTTHERAVDTGLLVTKRDGRQEEFNRKKLIQSIQVACAKRPIAKETITRLATEIEESLDKLDKDEITSSYIGQMVLARLKILDKVVYVRFASVYGKFDDVESIAKEIEEIKSEE